jgi:hypothetical protein
VGTQLDHCEQIDQYVGVQLDIESTFYQQERGGAIRAFLDQWTQRRTKRTTAVSFAWLKKVLDHNEYSWTIKVHRETIA